VVARYVTLPLGFGSVALGPGPGSGLDNGSRFGFGSGSSSGSGFGFGPGRSYSSGSGSGSAFLLPLVLVLALALWLSAIQFSGCDVAAQVLGSLLPFFWLRGSTPAPLFRLWFYRAQPPWLSLALWLWLWGVGVEGSVGSRFVAQRYPATLAQALWL